LENQGKARMRHPKVKPRLRASYFLTRAPKIPPAAVLLPAFNA
jgi:hypothetical protein